MEFAGEAPHGGEMMFESEGLPPEMPTARAVGALASLFFTVCARSLEHRSPIRGRVGSSKHLHSVLVLSHAVAVELRVDIRDLVAVVRLLEAAAACGSAHDGSVHVSSVSARIVKSLNAAGS